MVLFLQLRLHLSQLDLHLLHLLVRRLELLQPRPQPVGLKANLLPLNRQYLLIHGQQLQIGGGRNIIIPIKLMQKQLTIILHRFMYLFEHFHQLGYSSLNPQILLIINKLPSTNINECFLRPLSEPINR